jgi:hypothetical protein
MKWRDLDVKRRRWFLAAALVAVLSLAFVSPITIPYTITTPGKILCANEWIIALNTDGGIVTFVADRMTGVTKHYGLAQFSRGDAVSFTIDPRFTAGSVVQAGDTIGIARSTEVERELERLRGELRNAIAALAVTVTGEKQAVVEEAVQTVEHAKRQAEDLKAIHVRQKMLYEKGLVSQQEYELAERRSATAAIEVTIAEARLRSVTTGAKREQADLVRSQIKSLQNEIQVLERQEQGYRLIAPIAGIATQVGMGDTLLVVSDTTTYVVLMPVPVHERASLLPDQRVRLSAREVNSIPPASVTKVEKTIHALHGQQVVFATAQLSEQPDEILNGLIARCTIDCASLPPWEFLERKFRSLIR